MEVIKSQNGIPAVEPESYNGSHSRDSGSTAGMTGVSIDHPFRVPERN